MFHRPIKNHEHISPTLAVSLQLAAPVLACIAPCLSHISSGADRAMALLSLLAFLLATATAPAVGNATYDGSKTDASPAVLCNGEGCEPPAQPLPIYGYPSPAAPSLPSAPPAPPSAPGSQTPCPPVTVVCCGGAGGQLPQQPNSGPPGAGGYVPYYNTSAASPPALLLAPVTGGYYVMAMACIFLLWTLV